MALSAALTRAGHPPATVDTSARVHLDRDGAGFTITSIELTARAAVPGIDDATFAKIAGEAKATCPVSRALGAVPATLEAQLTGS